VVVGLDLLGDAFAERLLQRIFAAGVQHLLFDGRRVGAPVNNNAHSPSRVQTPGYILGTPT